MSSVLKQSDEIKIRVSQLSNGLHEYHFSAKPSDIGLGGNFTKQVEIDAVLDKEARQMYLKTDVKCSGMFQCDRCVEEFEQQVSNRVNMFYVYDEFDTGSHPPDEVQVISEDTVYIDLTDDIRQIVTLGVPLKLLCRDDCKGLCPRCGTNWNRATCTCQNHVNDSRWEGLKDLIKN